MKRLLSCAVLCTSLALAGGSLAEEPPRLTVRLIAGSSHGAVVRLDGAVLSPAVLGQPLAVTPGRHEVVVEAPDHRPRTFITMLSQGEQKTLDVSLGAGAFRSNGAGPLAAAHDEEDSEHTADFSQRTVGTSLASVGLAGIGFGSVFGIVALSTSDDGESRSAGQIATGFLIGGAIATIAGAIIYFTAPPSSSR